MNIKIKETTVSIKMGDITKESVDAIVNAANSGLRGGGGVDGAIHRAGGPKIMEECRKIGGCPPGQAVLTTGGNLPARYVIHTVGPIYRGGQRGEEETLQNAYINSLSLALQNNIRSLAFPSISTGVYGYPIEKAAQVVLETCLRYIEEHQDFAMVNFVLFSQNDYDVYVKTLRAVFSEKYANRFLDK